MSAPHVVDHVCEIIRLDCERPIETTKGVVEPLVLEFGPCLTEVVGGLDSARLYEADALLQALCARATSFACASRSPGRASSPRKMLS